MLKEVRDFVLSAIAMIAILAIFILAGLSLWWIGESAITGYSFFASGEWRGATVWQIFQHGALLAFGAILLKEFVVIQWSLRRAKGDQESERLDISRID